MLLIVSFYSEAGEDYIAVNEAPMFEKCTKDMCVVVTIIDDMSLEGTEYFNIKLDVMDDRVMVDEGSEKMTITIFEDNTDGRLL